MLLTLIPDMQDFMRPFPQSLPLTFYCRTFYADLIRRGQGIGMRFVLVQLILALIIPLFSLGAMISAAKIEIEAICAKMPDLTITNHKMSIAQLSPYSIDIATGDAHSMILFDMAPREIDVAQIEHQMIEQKILVLVTPDFAVTRKRSGVEIHNFNSFGSPSKPVVMTHDEWIAFGKNLVTWGVPLLGVVLVVGALLGRIFYTFIEGLCVKLVALFFKTKLDLASAMRLSAAAAVPPCTLAFVAAVGNLSLHQKFPLALPFWVTVLIWFGYVFYGLVCACKDARRPAA